MTFVKTNSFFLFDDNPLQKSSLIKSPNYENFVLLVMTALMCTHYTLCSVHSVQ